MLWATAAIAISPCSGLGNLRRIQAHYVWVQKRACVCVCVCAVCVSVFVCLFVCVCVCVCCSSRCCAAALVLCTYDDRVCVWCMRRVCARALRVLVCACAHRDVRMHMSVLVRLGDCRVGPWLSVLARFSSAARRLLLLLLFSSFSSEPWQRVVLARCHGASLPVLGFGALGFRFLGSVPLWVRSPTRR